MFDFLILFLNFKLMLELDTKNSNFFKNQKMILKKDIIEIIDPELFVLNNVESEIKNCFIKVKFLPNIVFI
jgi:hypothetical protein